MNVWWWTRSHGPRYWWQVIGCVKFEAPFCWIITTKPIVLIRIRSQRCSTRAEFKLHCIAVASSSLTSKHWILIVLLRRAIGQRSIIVAELAITHRLIAILFPLLQFKTLLPSSYEWLRWIWLTWPHCPALPCPALPCPACGLGL